MRVAELSLQGVSGCRPCGLSALGEDVCVKGTYTHPPVTKKTLEDGTVIESATGPGSWCKLDGSGAIQIIRKDNGEFRPEISPEAWAAMTPEQIIALRNEMLAASAADPTHLKTLLNTPEGLYPWHVRYRTLLIGGGIAGVLTAAYFGYKKFA